MYKGAGIGALNHYITLETSYIIHTFYSSYSVKTNFIEDSLI